MAIHKSVKKAARQAVVKTVRNKSRMNKIRTFIKKLEALITTGDKKNAKELFATVQSQIMRGVTKSLLKKNTAARKISKLSAKIKNLA